MFSRLWTSEGSKLIKSNSTHTTCSFNKISTYAVLSDGNFSKENTLLHVERKQLITVNVLLSISLFFSSAVSITYLAFRCVTFKST